jgi:hypothetical protein
MTQNDRAILGSFGHQALRRDLTAAERRLADALESIFAEGQHDFTQVAQQLQQLSIPRPSGASAPWTPEVLEEELKRINESLDRAYEQADARLG